MSEKCWQITSNLCFCSVMWISCIKFTKWKIPRCFVDLLGCLSISWFTCPEFTLLNRSLPLFYTSTSISHLAKWLPVYCSFSRSRGVLFLKKYYLHFIVFCDNSENQSGCFETAQQWRVCEWVYWCYYMFLRFVFLCDSISVVVW